MGKTAVVTGASGGVGLAIAKKLKIDGYEVIAISRTKPQDFDYDKWLPWDLAHPELLTNELMEREIGDNVTVFIANAGILKGISPSKYTYQDIKLIQDIHVNSHVLLANYLAGKMKGNKEGRVVFIGSTAGETGHPDIMYAATKAALVALTKSYANIYQNDGLTFNCLQPGAMRTKITKSMPQANRDYLGKNILIAGPYLDIDMVVEVTIELTRKENRINGSCITLGNNAVWR